MATEPRNRSQLTPAQQIRLDEIRARAIVDRQLGVEGPPVDVATTDNLFSSELRNFVSQLRLAREAAGLSAVEVAHGGPGWRQRRSPC